MKTLTKEQILTFHRELIGAHGGADGIRDEGLLESALAAPFQTFDGEALYPTVQQRAALLGFGLVANHPFLDGNKRTGAHAMLVMLAMNGIEPQYTQKELYEVILKVAAGEAGFDELFEWVLAR
jgi:death-on-curing protein